MCINIVVGEHWELGTNDGKGEYWYAEDTRGWK
jgi:hypothetical protein